MQTRFVNLIAVGALAIAASACGDDSDDTSDETGATADADTTDDDAPEADGEVVQTATTDLGEVLADSSGFTLYGFTDDTDGVPTCYDQCAASWPPVTVDGEDVPEGLDPDVFTVVERSDGTSQLAAGEWPLYRFAGDGPGDVNGQGVDDVWFAVTPEGELNQDGSSEADDTDTDTDTDTGGGY